MMLTATAVPAPVPGRRAEPPVRHCSRCEIIIYRSREEAAAVDRTFWAARRGHMTEASIRTDSSGVRFVPHVNGAVGDLCAACAREQQGQDQATAEWIRFCETYFGGGFSYSDRQNMSRSAGSAGGEMETNMSRVRVSDEEVIAVHRRYVLEHLSAEQVAKDAPLSKVPLQKRFRELNLPLRQRGSNTWSAEDLQRVCAVHNLEAADVLGEADMLGEAVGAPERAVGAPTAEREPEAESRQPRPTAVVPVQETAVATNGHVQPDDLREQLAVIQELLGLAEAKQVTLRGKISVELHAEVAF